MVEKKEHLLRGAQGKGKGPQPSVGKNRLDVGKKHLRSKNDSALKHLPRKAVKSPSLEAPETSPHKVQ